jgi:hypothetical protein
MVYRAVSNNPPSQEDFLSHREMWPTQKFSAPECEVCGLSVFTDKQDIERLIRRIPRMRAMLIAQGTLNPDLGNMKPTPSGPAHKNSHHTWWLPREAQPWLVFNCV